MASTFPDEKDIVKAIHLIGTLTTETTRFILEAGLLTSSWCFQALKKYILLDDSFTKSKQDVICPLLCLMQQRPDQLSLSCEVERHRMSQLDPRQPRNQAQGEI